VNYAISISLPYQVYGYNLCVFLSTVLVLCIRNLMARWAITYGIRALIDREDLSTVPKVRKNG
jgi:hypothetical protein